MGYSRNRLVAAVLGFTLFAATASAQSMSVTPGTLLKVGETAKIAYSDPARAGQTVVVLVAGGFPVPTLIEVPITLDKNGNGTGAWIVVGSWRNATFSAPGVSDVSIPIQ